MRWTIAVGILISCGTEEEEADPAGDAGTESEAEAEAEAEAEGEPAPRGTWQGISAAAAPSARWGHSAVWTGSEMIVWGGTSAPAGSPWESGLFRNGARYDPSDDSWSLLATQAAPAARIRHTAVWTGSEMIVWGGMDDSSTGGLATGGRYDPATDAWAATSTSGAPLGRYGHLALWLGSSMLVWGARPEDCPGDEAPGCADGGLYDPALDAWTPIDPRVSGGATVAAWTGTEAILWYDTEAFLPSTRSWRAIAQPTFSMGRFGTVGAWTGTSLIVWGGRPSAAGDGVEPPAPTNEGGAYTPSTDSWTALSTANAPAAPTPDIRVSAAWTGSEVVFWGDSAHHLYASNSDSWTEMSTVDAPAAPDLHTAVWTGSEFITWGGIARGEPVGTGGRFRP